MAIISMPHADRATNMGILTVYGTLWMKYGAQSLVRKEGMTSASRTTPLGTLGPTRSRAAERIMTYRTLLIRPKSQKEAHTRGSAPSKTAFRRAR